jgi:lysine-specific demethylase 8
MLQSAPKPVAVAAASDEPAALPASGFHGLRPDRRLPPVPTLDWHPALPWKKLLLKRQPLVIRGYVATWPARERWTLDYLEKKAGDTTINATVLGRDGITDLDYGPPGTPNLKALPFHDVVAQIKAQVGRGAREGDLYVAQGGNIFGNQARLAALADDVRIPDFGLPLQSMNLWLGAGGNTTYLHFDAAFNMLSMIEGEKRLVLISPEQTKRVYPIFGADALGSATNLRRPDYARFPELERATYREVHLRPGDSLLIPPGMWHYVVSSGLNVAVNFWCNVNLLEWVRNRPMRGLALSFLKSEKRRAQIAKEIRRQVTQMLGVRGRAAGPAAKA